MNSEDGWNWVWERFHGLDPNGIGEVSGDSGAVGILGAQAPAAGQSAVTSAPSVSIGNSKDAPAPDLPKPVLPKRMSGVPAGEDQMSPASYGPRIEAAPSARNSEGILGHIASPQAKTAPESTDALVSAPGIASDNRWQGFKDAAHMTAGWALGTGSDNRTFGPGSVQVAEMKNAPGVNGARDYFYTKNAKQIADDSLRHLQPVKDYAARFGLGDFLTNSSPTQQFVGSYGVKIEPINNGADLRFTLTNNSSFKSLGYGLMPDWERSSFGPGGNMRQTYTWSEPLRRQ